MKNKHYLVINTVSCCALDKLGLGLEYKKTHLNNVVCSLLVMMQRKIISTSVQVWCLSDDNVLVCAE